MEVFQRFYQIAGDNFADLNKAFIALLPKKDGATEMSHYRPISLIHSITKLIAKVLSMRLATALKHVISPV